jgi:LmbE family N-acetylglucosaminyl deacetylase
VSAELRGMGVPKGPLVVVSPHLDDGVFGCGELLLAHPGSVVITALARPREDYRHVTDWDARAGFAAGEDVVAARRAEDRAALAHLGARPVWLDYTERQYGEPPSPDELADGLEAAILATHLRTVLIPLGMFHSDHVLTNQAGLIVLRRRPEWSWFGYEDAMYRRIDTLFAERMARFPEEQVAASPAGESPPAGAVKWRAMQEYRSQLRALDSPGRPGYADALQPERYWRLAAAEWPAGRGAYRAAAHEPPSP